MVKAMLSLQKTFLKGAVQFLDCNQKDIIVLLNFTKRMTLPEEMGCQ